MSTWIYLECHSHDPPICSADEVGQHLYDLPRIRREVRNRKEVKVLDRWEVSGYDSYFTPHVIRFLQSHTDCDIRIVDEYDREHPLEPEDGGSDA